MTNDNHDHPIVEELLDGVPYLFTDYELITLFLNEKLIPNNKIRKINPNIYLTSKSGYTLFFITEDIQELVIMANDNHHHHPMVEEWPDGVRLLPMDYQLITLFLNEREEGLYKLIPNNRIRYLDDIFSPPPPKIFHYLNQREKGVYKLLPNKGLDHVFSCSPPKIFQKYRLKTDENWFFYSKLKKHYSNRMATGDGEGYWKEWSTTNVIDVADQTIIGRRKDLRFYKYRGGDATAMKTNWIIHEYSSTTTTNNNNGGEPVGELDDVLLYMIYNTDLLDKPPGDLGFMWHGSPHFSDQSIHPSL